MRRPGNNPKRRIAASDFLSEPGWVALAEAAKYTGSGHHKRSPADYGFERTNPRPTKSLCDLLRVVTLAEAQTMLRKGIICEMFSDFFFGQYPKFVWCVDCNGEVYEAKTAQAAPGEYHGYRLEEDDDMRAFIKRIWRKRCPRTGP